MGAQLLNCQIQSHFSWLIVIPIGQKSLQFGAGRDFHPFMPLLYCHNKFVALKTTVSVTVDTL